MLAACFGFRLIISRSRSAVRKLVKAVIQVASMHEEIQMLPKLNDDDVKEWFREVILICSVDAIIDDLLLSVFLFGGARPAPLTCDKAETD